MAFSLFQWQQQQQIETNTFGIWFFSHWLMENPPQIFNSKIKSGIICENFDSFRLCDMNGGHKQVSDAISMLRLRFGEPVRLKFLVGMLNSYNSTGQHTFI